jgi:flagellar FliJ protein
MKRFRFPLRPVVTLRAHREIRARESFAAAVHAYVLSEEKLMATRARVARFEGALFAGRSGTFNPAAEAQQLTAYRRECEAEVEAERATFAARAEMDRCRADYLTAHRDLEVVQRLETKSRLAHRLEANREEQAEFDDFAARRAMRRSPLFSS